MTKKEKLKEIWDAGILDMESLLQARKDIDQDIMEHDKGMRELYEVIAEQL